MYLIKDAQVLARNIKEFKVEAPEIAVKAQPGQFVIVRQNEKAERIPLTIADFNRNEGLITIIFQEVGRSTADLGKLKPGDYLLDFVGPLGVPSDIRQYGTVVCVGGGVGVAPLYPITKALYNAGNRILSIIGARSADYIILEKEIQGVSETTMVTTDDGSYGEKGLVINPLKRILDSEKVDLVVAIGPLVMMESVCTLTRSSGIKTVVSLNPIMLDGTGMCGACRVQVGNERKFACVDGPEFDGHLVDWGNAKKRARMFEDEERIALSMTCCNQGGEGSCHQKK
ncbi:MAG: sulfide/dihydroorotate dehydrogenase-like FAD/NAD-binding protein [Syntrophomonadaceae bacterium]|nr:sulfide/dihydroorotate dehydrogenase-like FAD/NAD-binding protein [Syntrophomonadaceae bacterium]